VARQLAVSVEALRLQKAEVTLIWVESCYYLQAKTTGSGTSGGRVLVLSGVGLKTSGALLLYTADSGANGVGVKHRYCPQGQQWHLVHRVWVS
jgi:hypothetical protein